MLETNEPSKEDFLQKTKNAREERANEKNKELAAIKIQKCVRCWLERKRDITDMFKKFDNLFISSEDSSKIKLKPAAEVYDILDKFLQIYKKKRDKEKLDNVCKYLLHSLESDSIKLSYIGVALIKDRYLLWIAQVKKILYYCLIELEDLQPERFTDYKCILLRLNTIVSFTSTQSWAIMRVQELSKLKAGMNQLCSNITGHLVKNNFYPIMQTLLIKGLCRKNISLQPVALTAIITLTIRPLIFSNVGDDLLLKFVMFIFSVPSLVYHLNHKDQSACISLIKQNNIFSQSIHLLKSNKNVREIHSTLSSNHYLCLMANLMELAYMEEESLIEEVASDFTHVISNMLTMCQKYVVTKTSHTTYWHPILGWFEQAEEPYMQDTIPLIKVQLSRLWTGKIVTKLLSLPISEIISKSVKMLQDPQNSNGKRPIFSKAALGISSKKGNIGKNFNEFGSSESNKIAQACSLYYTALCTLKEMKSTILTGLCYQEDNILYNLWLFFRTLGPDCGLSAFLNLFPGNPQGTAVEFEMLILFCDCMTHYVIILDDIEMYEKQHPFKLSDFLLISQFLNQFLYKSIFYGLIDDVTVSWSSVFTSVRNLLMTIYRRDCQKAFCPEDHWLIKDVRVSNFLTDLKKGKRKATVILSIMPHILPHNERVRLFRNYVTDEKESMGLSSSSSSRNSLPATLITVHRSKIVEDGYRQLSVLSPRSLKGVIRVRFVNEQGLDEAGIDQDGVFKEFLEEIIKRVFDPNFNLFKVTDDNRLYPSSSSHLQDNHLLLFEFIGRMLGKAVYEGIVVDVPFASFFVSQFCGQSASLLHSWFDELASLDKDLYKSLTLVKHYDGDVAELGLTFSLDESVMGDIQTFELKSGGKAVPVTNENKINYIHLMAHFRMYEQIKHQITAFTKGFRSIIKQEWLTIFSTPEWQRLISGDNIPVDLSDLRKYTQYYGGFHDKHRVVRWLWEILEKDFTERERGLFLKFVTSCSKPPLLGFAYLDPPFSIRCIEVSDDEDTGDTIGSVIRGFFTIRKKDPQNRLPTSSTCFNLLKLPNYRKKCTLRDKLRYAVTSSTGFELS
ncbi:ubiquitin-protein ligase E3B [Trichogramma pretiosum]|uniref:ubiquitin-protein ligase E3B n=1 Tax=Trichogramma pretiosum TaxID=7493 RepID=UPI0006C9A4A4|nr:ubiquitin-protein ligase E3B [Trichogramma pretiosum]